jgi:hypothetical protein
MALEETKTGTLRFLETLTTLNVSLSVKVQVRLLNRLGDVNEDSHVNNGINASNRLFDHLKIPNITPNKFNSAKHIAKVIQGANRQVIENPLPMPRLSQGPNQVADKTSATSNQDPQGFHK